MLYIDEHRITANNKNGTIFAAMMQLLLQDDRVHGEPRIIVCCGCLLIVWVCVVFEMHSRWHYRLCYCPGSTLLD